MQFSDHAPSTWTWDEEDELYLHSYGDEPHMSIDPDDELRGHKFALLPIETGAPIVKLGEQIGRASAATGAPAPNRARSCPASSTRRNWRVCRSNW